jgi:hypothetical protein
MAARSAPAVFNGAMERGLAKTRRKIACAGTFRVDARPIFCFQQVACVSTRLTIPGRFLENRDEMLEAEGPVRGIGEEFRCRHLSATFAVFSPPVFRAVSTQQLRAAN